MKFSWCITTLIFCSLLAFSQPINAWCPSGAPDPVPRPPDGGRPPGDPTPPPTPGDPAPKKVGGGKKKAGGSSQSLDVWELWWEANKARYLLVKEIIEVEKEEKAPDEEDGSVIVKSKKAAEPLRALLRKAIKDDDRNIRMVAAAAIGRVADPELMELLYNAIDKDKSNDVVDTAVMALGTMETTKPVEKLWEILKNPRGREMTRGFAAIGLGFTRSNAKTDEMIQLLKKEKDDQVKAAIAVALGLSGDLKAIEPLGKIILHKNKKAYSDQTRSFAAISLGRLKHADALPFLLKATRHKKVDVRRAAWLALGDLEINDPKKDNLRVNTLIKGIKKESDSQALGFLLISLGKTNSNFASFHLKKQLLGAKKMNVRGFAAIGLGLLRDEKSIKALHKGWKKAKNVSTLNAITISLGLARDREAIKLIKARMKERRGDRTYQAYAAEAFALMRASSMGDDLLALMKDSTNFVNVVRACAIALQMMGRNESRPHLEELMKENNNFIVANAALTLGQIGNKEVLKSLLDTYDSMSTNFVKQYAIVAMGSIYEQRKVTIFRELSINNNYRARTLVYDHALKIP